MSLKTIAAILIAIGLIACYFVPEPKASNSLSVDDTSVYEIKLHDGTPCVVVSAGFRSAAVSCGWERR